MSGALHTYDPTFEMITYTNGETLIDELRDSGFDADLLFLDIYMPGIDGIKTAQRLRSERKELKIVFISSSQEHYSQAYEVFAFNYLVKPFDKERLYYVLDRVIDQINREHSHKIRFSFKSVMYSVDCRDIQYLESHDKLILLHLSDGSTLQCYKKLDSIAEELPEQSFIRCHQSFIVNTSYVTEMGENHFRIGQVVIGISKKYLKPAKDQYYAALFSHVGRGQWG